VPIEGEEFYILVEPTTCSSVNTTLLDTHISTTKSDYDLMMIERLVPRNHVLTARESTPITGLGRPRGFQEVEAPRFQDTQHMKVVRLSALRTGRLYTPKKYSWYSFLLETESTPGP
jgi:hypothetical protein